MKKVNLHTRGAARKVNSDWFTSKTRMKEIGGVLGIRGQNMYHVYFEGGSRTKLHKHDGDQVLVVTRGDGILETFRRTGGGRDSFGIRRSQRTSLSEGDVVYIPAGTLHVHGSANPRKVFSHIAVNILSGKKKEYGTTWYESDFKSRADGVIR